MSNTDVKREIAKNKEVKMARIKTLEGKKVSIKIDAPGAKRVTIAGDFNKWNSSDMTLQKSKGSEWTTELTLRPGRYEYKLVVDGRWIIDPSNSNKSRNSYGTENSVLVI